MSIIDIIIIVILLLGTALGLKRGFTKQLVCSLGTVLSIIFAFLLKNKISILLYSNLPFYKFGGVLKGVTVLNILLYELIAFILIFVLLSIAFKFLSFLTSVLEGVLTASLIFGIPSRILGAVLGFVEAFIFVFILLFIFTLPIFQFNDYITKNSKFADKILLNTPIVSSYTKDAINIANEFADLKDEYKKEENSMKFNQDTLRLFLKYKIVTVDSIETLVKKDKLKIDRIEEILECYKQGTEC